MDDAFSSLFAVCIFVICVAGWITHIVYCFMAAAWGLLIAGAIFFPIGVVHGIGRWFGWW
jgi:hypothetical protein